MCYAIDKWKGNRIEFVQLTFVAEPTIDEK